MITWAGVSSWRGHSPRTRQVGWSFIGTYGCGKTHLAAAIANYQLTVPGRSIPMFVVVPDLLDHLRATFSPTSPTTLDRLFEQVKSTPLLILDDLGTESATPWAREKLFQLLNYRYAARLPTVITTFSQVKELDERLASRMEDSSRCTVHGIIAPSYRGSRTQQVGKPCMKLQEKILNRKGGAAARGNRRRNVRRENLETSEMISCPTTCMESREGSTRWRLCSSFTSAPGCC